MLLREQSDLFLEFVTRTVPTVERFGWVLDLQKLALGPIQSLEYFSLDVILPQDKCLSENLGGVVSHSLHFPFALGFCDGQGLFDSSTFNE